MRPSLESQLTPGPMRTLSIRYRAAFWLWLSGPGVDRVLIDGLEIDAADAIRGGNAWLEQLAAQYRLTMYHAGASLTGAAGPPMLPALRDAAHAMRPQWITVPLGCRRVRDPPSVPPLPAYLDAASLARAVDRAHLLAEACGASVAVRNIAAPLRIASPLRETEWINRWCDRTGGGVSLDVTALELEGRTHGFAPAAWIREIDPRYLREVSIGGSRNDEATWLGTRTLPVPEPLASLANDVLGAAPVQNLVLSCTSEVPALGAVLDALRRLRDLESC